MHRERKRQLLVLCVGICAIMICGSAWIAGRVIAWACDLPNRITFEIDDDAADAFGNAVIEYLHLSLNDPNPKVQQTTIQSFADWIAQDRTMISWVRNEFSADLETASKSTNVDVAAAASSLLAALAEPDVNPLPE